MLSAVERTIREQALFEPGARILVAVSGGCDSMALLQVLHELAARWSLVLEVATVDHGLRPASGDEARFVADEAARRALPAHVLALRLAEQRRPESVSVMTWARDQRRAALLACAEARGMEVVALGHHADDQVETILFRLLRGTGLEGLGGMRPRHQGFVRPLLDLRRRDLLLFNQRRQVPFVEDPSNVDRRFARSRLRHDVLPLLRRENPRVDEALLALAREARGQGKPRSPQAALRDRLRSDGLYATSRALSAMLSAAERGGSRRFDVAGGAVEVSYGVTRVVRGPSPRTRAPEGAPPSHTLSGPGHLAWGAASLSFREADAGIALASEVASSAGFDADRVPWPWQVRAWQPGDRMRPRGGVGSRKLSDLFIDARIPRTARQQLPVVVGPAGEILFVPGLRPSEEGRPTTATRHLVLVEADTKGLTERPR